MSYEITVDLIPGLPELPYRNGVGNYEGVVAHATANYGDTAAGERNYEAGHYNDAFVHFFVDHTSIIQGANTKYLAWGAGHVANQRFVHVELCQTHDNAQFQEAYKRYVWLLAKLLKDRNLGVTRKSTFWTHHDVSTVLGDTDHTDPDEYLASHGVSIDKLVADVAAEYNDSASSSDGHYTVQNGDTLYEIAKKFSLTVAQLKSINGLTSDTIKPGQVLIVKQGVAKTTSVSQPVNQSVTVAPKPAPVQTSSFKYNYTRTLQAGSTGDDVKHLQTALNSVYYNCGTPDGYYGPATRDAVRRFQSVFLPYEVDGIAGKHTTDTLNSKVK
jgi:N-acetylmuramoyl-L-alanine amidase CwlA